MAPAHRHCTPIRRHLLGRIPRGLAPPPGPRRSPIPVPPRRTTATIVTPTPLQQTEALNSDLDVVQSIEDQGQDQAMFDTNNNSGHQARENSDSEEEAFDV